MEILRSIRLIGQLCGVALCVAGCEAIGTGTPISPSADGTPSQTTAAHPSWWREAPQAARAGVYVTQANGSTDGMVFGYAAKNKSNRAPECLIGNQRFDHTQIAADSSGNLYLPNAETATIGVYAPNCGTLIASISDPYGSDVDVALGRHAIYGVGGNHVAVCTMSACSSALTDSSILQLETAAVDSQGNVWASYYSQQGPISLIVWPGGSMPGKIVSGYVNQNTPGGLEFDKRDNLISVQTEFSHVYVYRCDAATATCTNTNTVALQAASLFGAINAKNTAFAVTDYANDAVDVYAYPTFKYEYSYSRGLSKAYSIQGIAQTR